MHGSTRLPSRSGPRRRLGVPSDTCTTSRPSLFTLPPPAPAMEPLRLPILAPACVASSLSEHNSRDVKESAVQSARLRYTSSLKKKTVRPPPRGPALLSASVSQRSTPPPPPLSSVEPASCPESKPLTFSYSYAPPISTACTVAENARSPGSSTASNLATLLKQQEYAELYFVLSTLLPITSRRLLKEDTHTMRILSYRAICSCALLRFKESAEDGIACLDIRQRLRREGCVPSSEEDQRLNARVDECVVRALVMSERYEEADRVANSLRGSTNVVSMSLPVAGDAEASTIATETGTSGTAVTTANLTVSTWQNAIPHVQHFRSAVAAHQWREALNVVDTHSTTVGACLRASPLCAMLAFVHLETGQPMAARGLLLGYLAELPEPPTWASLSAAPPEHAQLWDSFRSHYVFSTTLLAKASVMSGSAYLNIAAALLQRCLRVLPLYTPARLLAEFVLSFEAQQVSLEVAMAKRDYNAAMRISSRMLTLPEINPALQAEVYLVRTQVQWMRRQPLEVVREASQCIAADPACALALRLRADALAAMQQVAEAVADRAAATAATTHHGAKASVDAAYAELQSQRRKYEAAQRTSEAQRRSFIVFTTAAAATNVTFTSFATTVAHRHSAPWEDTDDDADDAQAASPNSTTRAGASGSSSTSFFSSTRCGADSGSTLYAVLGVPPYASLSEIRQRYRQLTLQCHPDRFVNASADRRLQAAEEFKRVSNAYSVLSDAQQRSDYDATLYTRS